MAVDRLAFQSVGGFDTSLVGVGSEDLALSRRLWIAGARFRLLLDFPAFHWPHPRDRAGQLARDRRHERQLLSASPARDVELLAAFDGEHMNAVAQLLDEKLAPYLEDLGAAFKLPATSLDSLCGPVDMVVGLPHDAGCPSPVRVWPGSLGSGEDPSVLDLYGFALPFPDQSVGTIVIAGLWELLPLSFASRVLAEAKRVGRDIYLLRRAHTRGPRPQWRDTEIAAIDRPYWEVGFPVSRDLWEHPTDLVGSAGDFDLFRVGTTSLRQVA